MRLRVGQAVIHRVYGRGVVLGIRDRARVRVRFMRWPRLPLTVPEYQLDYDGDGVSVGKSAGPSRRPSRAVSRFPARAAASPKPTPPGPGEVPDLRQAVEALRLGVVPRSYVGDYTVARERELADFEALLDGGRGLRLVWGDYGAGKTHLLDMYDRIALQRGFVTAWVTLNPRETPPSHPQRLFRAIVRSLRYPGGRGEGLEPLFLDLAESRDHVSPRGRRASRVFSPVLHAFRYPESEAFSWTQDYIEGYPMDVDYGSRALRRIGWRGPRPLALSDYRTYGRMYVHLVGTLATWASDAGFEGLVVLFDEVEYVEMTQGASRRLAEEVLQHYAAVTLPWKKLSFDPRRLYRGGRSVHRHLSLWFDEKQPLIVVMALTPLPEAQAVARRILLHRESDLHLSVLTDRDFGELACRVTNLYARAYPCFVPDAGTVARISEAATEQAALGDANPREIVRRTVLDLDAIRLSPGTGGD